MIRPKVCLKCKSVNIENSNDDETDDGTVEFWHCEDCFHEWGIELKVIQILTDGGMENVTKL